MSVRILGPASIVLIILATLGIPATNPQPSSPTDLKITIRQTLGAKSFESTEYSSGAASRYEMQPFSGDVPRHHRAIIRQRGSDRIQVFDLDLDAREYVTYETTLLGTSLSASLPGTSLARSAKARRLQPSGRTVQVFSDSVDTGETKEIFGHLARHIITKVRQVASPGACSSSSESETDGWYIGYDALPEWRRPGKGDGKGGFLVVSYLAGGNCANTFDKFEFHRSGPVLGYPLTITTSNRSEQTLPDGSTKEFTSCSKMEVVGFTRAPLDPALFQVPPGFRKVHRLADQRSTAEASGLQALWQWLEDTWDDLFD